MLGPLRRAVRAQSGLLRLPVRSLAVPSIERQKHTASGAVHAHADTFLTYETFNEQVKQAQYAVRGEVVIRAMAHASALRHGEKRPFKDLVFCNIGNPHELGQKPITFFRQVFSLVNYPEMIDHPGTAELFPADAIDRARRYMKGIPGGTGAYSNSQGIELIREEVASFLQRRDDVPAHAKDIFLTDGASPAVQMGLRALIRDSNDGIMLPIPQYPLYSACIALYGGSQVPYYLEEERGWGMSAAELERALQAAVAQGKRVRALVVINPGNPTGNTLPEETMKEVVQFCRRHKLVLLADEVYQDNVYQSRHPWCSFKAVASSMGLVSPAHTNRNSGLQLMSFHSTSKGFVGECGRRGGFVELCGFDEAVRAEFYKLASISLCSNVGGQIMTGLMVNPPQPKDESFALYAQERDNIAASLKRRAQRLVAGLRKLEGVQCQDVEGALYAFPSIALPPRAIAAAKAANKQPDVFYCLQLLDATGVVLVPGSGFGQRDGTFHFRSTILPPEHALDDVVKRISDFHASFLSLYR